jgi:hypothetical protein
MGNQRKTARRISTVVEVNKQSFGKDIVANCGAACQGKSSATQKVLTGRPLRVRLAVVNRLAVDDPFLAKPTMTQPSARARRRS